MKKILVIVILVFIGYLIDLFWGCQKVENKFEWDSLSAIALKNSNPITSSSDSICATQFGIRLKLHPQYYSFHRRFVESCYATSLAHMWTNRDTVKSIKIFSNGIINQFNSGDDIASLFRGKRSGFEPDLSNLMEIDGIINYMNSPMQNEIYDYDIFLINTTTQRGIYSFVVNIELSGNRYLIDTTQSVILY